MKTKLYLIVAIFLLAMTLAAIATPVAAQCTPNFAIDYVLDAGTWFDAEPSYVGQEIQVLVGYGACGDVAITVDYGDGTAAGTGGPGEIVYYHTYTAAGEYTITATLEDTVDGVTTSVTDTWAHTVVEAPPADSRIRLEQKPTLSPYLFAPADAAYCADGDWPCSIAESVQVPASDALVISQIQLWGAYVDPTTYTDDFTVVLRSDGDGPGDALYREEHVASLREDWIGWYLYPLTLTLAQPQTLAGGSEGAAYWIEIYNNGTSAAPDEAANYFFWMGGLPDADSPYYLAGADQGFAETNASWQPMLYNGLPVDLSLVLLAPAEDLNTAPTANPGGPYLAAINTAIAFDGNLSADADGDALTYAWDFGDGASGTGATPTHVYAATGIYDVCLTVNDGAENSAPVCTMAVVYDPSAGFVTGSGSIISPEGAYKLDATLSGKATFGFVSKYKKGASLPTGNTEFHFEAGAFSFHSSAYDWLVVSKDKVTAQFKGAGTVNGELAPNGNAYKFLLWAGDGVSTTGGDTFRIRIWWEDAAGAEHDVYDNGFDQESGGGNIVVHVSK